jgi:hypothetical protein
MAFGPECEFTIMSDHLYFVHNKKEAGMSRQTPDYGLDRPGALQAMFIVGLAGQSLVSFSNDGL